MLSKLLLINVALLFYSGVTFSFDIANETKLRVDLLTSYNVKVRPKSVTIVNLVFNLLTINELATPTQTFSVSGFFTVVWEDLRLQWTTADYNDIGFIFGDDTELWRPALVLKNAVTNLDVIANSKIPFRVVHTGMVFWNPPGIFQVNCELDTTYYPFDTQTCSMDIQSWGYNLRELDLVKYGTGVQIGEYKANGEWNLLRAYSQREEKVESVDSESYASVSFMFRVQRRAEYYGLNIILPVVVLSLLSSLVFLLPADSGEKMGFSLTVLLALTVFLTLIADRMPTTSTYTSYMAVYLAIILCMNALAVLLTVVVLDFHFHFQATPVPPRLRTFARNVLQPILCARNGKSTGAVSANHVATDPTSRSIKETISGKDNMVHEWYEGRAKSASDFEIVNMMTWKDISQLIDRLFFRVYIIAIIAVNVIFFAIMAIGSSAQLDA